MENKKHLFRIWYADSNDRREMGHIIASDIEKVEEYIRIAFICDNVPKEDINLECYDEGISIFEISLCPQCEHQNSEYCEDCENNAEFIEIEDTGTDYTEEEASFDLITGETVVYREDEEGNIIKDDDHDKRLINLLKMSNGKKPEVEYKMIRIFDTGKRYADRYTIIIENSMYTMSADAQSPQGVNMYCCEVQSDYVSIGKEIEMRDAPQEVRWAIRDRLKGHITHKENK